MLDNLILRRASIAEADKLGALAFEAWDSSMNHIISPESDDQYAEERRGLLLAFQLFCINCSGGITVAEHDGVPAGWCGRDAMSPYISDLWVAPQFQRCGFGRALLYAVEQDIFRSGHDVSVLETHAENGGAIRFYAREGYGIIWRGVKYSKVLGQRIEKVRMEKQLVVHAH